MRLFTAIFFVLIVSSSKMMAQFNYDNSWKQVTALEEKGLPKSALEIVNGIYSHAVKEKMTVQQIKALIYRMKYNDEVNDSSTLQNLEQLNREIAAAAGPQKAILQSIKGDILRYYYLNNRYQLLGRTTLANDTGNDITTWGVDRLFHEISAAYMGSLADRTSLEKTALTSFDPIIVKGNTRTLRPTLYDLLAHRALDFFKSGEATITKPANQFELTDPAVFAPAATFGGHTFTSSDPASLQFQALLILQELTRLHTGDKAALLDIDLERIAYAYQASVMENKDALYVAALEQLRQANAGDPGQAAVLSMLATHYVQAGNQGNETMENRAAALKKAKELCEQAVELAPNSSGGVECARMLEQLKTKALLLTTEVVNVPDQAFRTLVTYKNINKLYLRVIKVDEEFLAQLQKAQADYSDRQQKYWKLITGRQSVKDWQQPLPDPADYLQHNTEIKIDALPVGHYILLASSSPAFSTENNPLAIQLTWVSSISYISNGDLYYALDRTSGKPLAGVTLNVMKYDYKNNQENWSLYKSGVTGADGSVNIATPKNMNSVRLHWKKAADELYLTEYKYQLYNVELSEKEQIETFLFTDRGIYRPGQTVYFKGIVIRKAPNASRSDILTNYTTTLTLSDANGDKVDSIKVTTNDYGAYSGKFTLPEGRMNGSFALEDNRANAHRAFQVEEYKRPKFYVQFDTIKGNYRLGDTVTTHAKALAYAGNNIDGAKVTWRVVRHVRFPYPWLFHWKIIPRGSSREIAHGETTTDANGAFTVKFPALADKSVSPATKPIFNYEVFADVTDLNGETRSSQQYVNAGYQSMEIGITAPDRLEQKDLDQIRISSTNLNGAFQPAQLTVQLKPLEPVKRLLRHRYWDEPDQFVMDESSYIKDFPLDIYKNEDDPKSWPRKEAVMKETVAATEEGRIKLDTKKLAPGFYEMEVSTIDNHNDSVVQRKTFEIVDPAAKTLSVPSYLWTYQPEHSVEPGKTAALLLGTSVTGLHIIESKRTVTSDKDIRRTLELSGVKKLDFPVTENDRGNIELGYVFVKDNRLFTVHPSIIVPWDNKALDVKLGTHRDKLLPGEQEKWTVQISGYKQEKVAAEMLVSMYDASLDAFSPGDWYLPGINPFAANAAAFEGNANFKIEVSNTLYNPYHGNYYPKKDKTYDQLNLFGWNMWSQHRIMAYGAGAPGIQRRMLSKNAAYAAVEAAPAPAAMMETVAKQDVSANDKEQNKVKESAGTNQAPPAPAAEMPVRTNFQETAFFLPDLRTDKDGNISFGFTVPEALTKWNFQGLAHTKDLSFGLVKNSIVTQKMLMIQPNAPRFVREGDKMEFTAKVTNLSDSMLIGQAHLELLDAATMQPVDGWFQNIFPTQHFTAKAGQSTVVTFPLQIPHGFQSALVYRVVAQAGNFSDGEENAVPVLTNRMLVTESLPLPVRGDGKHEFSFNKLLQSGGDQTLSQHAVTVEYTSNPAWYAVQALPYLMEFPYECAEQVFNRYYANTLATHIANATPKLNAIFEKWKTADTAALMSNLEKNQELKNVLLQETPWVMAAKNETEQKKHIALLFDLQRMQKEGKAALDQLAAKQAPNGAFPWFTGMWDDRFVTQYILAGLGHLQQLTGKEDSRTSDIANKAMEYLDIQLDKDYHELIKQKADLKGEHITDTEIHYLYARSFFKRPVPAAFRKSFDYFYAQQQKYWLKQSRYAQGMIALSLFRNNDQVTPKAILKSLKENAMNSKEMGMYWKDMAAGYSWRNAPIETQALLIEAFQVAGNDAAAVNDMKTWLLKNKQTNNWHTTKATADACYAMLLQGSNWLAAAPEVNIQLGSTAVKPAATEAGTGYFKERFDAKAVKPDMGNITVTVHDSKGQPSWGAVYWQYFQDLDKITAAATPLVLEKELFKEVNTDKGPVLTKIEEGNQLKVGDKVKVRVVMRADRDMEYIHLKDMRAACFEPVNVISAAKWQNGMSYYESTRDASTDFFFSYLPKGTHVFEYTLFVTHQGKFSNGISTAQCMYAPEFSAHSSGLNVKVTE